MENIISLNNVSVAYTNQVVLKNISLTIEKNDFLGIIGPNGGGKTTFVKLLLGLISPFEGDITIDDTIRNNIGYLPQKNQFDNQFPISIKEVIESGFIGNGFLWKNKQHKRKQVAEIIDTFHLNEYADRQISQVSGGQLQKALLARAVVSNPSLLILDEPDTYIDITFEKEMYEILKSLNEKMAIVLVTHDAGMISSYIKAVACINKTLHYHKGGKICEESLKMYECPIELVSHGDIPHRVLTKHDN